MGRPAIGVAVLVAVVLGAATAGCGRGPGDDSSATPPPEQSPPMGTALPTPSHEYPPVGSELTPDAPATVTLPQTGDLAQRLARDANLEVVVTLEFPELASEPDFAVMVFANTPDADAATPTTEPGFLGTVSFPHESASNDEPVRFVLPAGQAVARTSGDGPLRITLVPVPFDQPAAGRTYPVTVTAAIIRAG